MNTEFWGPRAWDFLFSIAMNYNPQRVKGNKIKHKQFIESLQYILPCNYCRDSFSKFIKVMPVEPYLCSNRQFMFWLYLLKCHVNNKLREQGNYVSKEPTFDDVFKKYSLYKSSSTTHGSDKRKRKNSKNSKSGINKSKKPNYKVKLSMPMQCNEDITLYTIDGCQHCDAAKHKIDKIMKQELKKDENFKLSYAIYCMNCGSDGCLKKEDIKHLKSNWKLSDNGFYSHNDTNAMISEFTYNKLLKQKTFPYIFIKRFNKDHNKFVGNELILLDNSEFQKYMDNLF